MNQEDIALTAHLMRRAGFGVTRSELEVCAAQGYEATVEDLLHPERFPSVDDEHEDLLERYLTYPSTEANHRTSGALWLYRMVNTKRPLEEKMTLFWHGLFATGGAKIISGRILTIQIEMFRQHALGNFRTMLVELSKDPAMIYWLDNCQNHGDAPNENFGRELLELFSMGVGNYTEDDVKMAARAFTGWTINWPTVNPFGLHENRFKYVHEDHDDSEKEFLGERGRFNGEDIIDIIVKQPATATFFCRLLYNFFVADEPPVAAWSIEPPRDPEAVKVLSEAFVDSGYEITAVLRTLFNSDFFKEARFAKVKSPVELVVGITRLVGDITNPYDCSSGDSMTTEDLLNDTFDPSMFMGQELLNPPSVEGWHTGEEWIDSGTLVERINFASAKVTDTTKAGVRDIIDRLREGRKSITPEELVDGCLDLLGPVQVSQETRDSLLAQAAGDIGQSMDTSEGNRKFDEAVARVLKLTVSSREYQFA